MADELPDAGWWDRVLAARPIPPLQPILDGLPPEVLAYLSEQSPRLVVWGCGVLPAVKELTAAYRACEVAGVELSPAAAGQARETDPSVPLTVADPGRLPRGGEMTFALDQLRHFADPLARLSDLLAATRDVCVVTVPLGEHPLAPFSRSQFRRESLPDRHGTFAVIRTQEFDHPAGGRFLLAVYASAAFRRTRGRSDRAASEQDKWDAYYAGLGEAQETPALAAFGAEFAGVLDELLPAGGSVLEAGCGAGFQSLAVAREGRLAVSMMDISPQAVAAAERLFARAGLTADARLGDVFATGTPAHDLVFNAGVLEHYTLDQQAAFLRGMASRTRKYVLVLVPNRLCYWYWVWRVQQAGRGNWPYGKEVPLADMAAAFRAAGLTYLGQTFLGAGWTEDLIANVQGLPVALRDEILAAHRGGLVDPAQRCYLTAALGCVGEPPPPVPARWTPGAGGEMRLAEVTAGLADSLALRLSVEAELREARAAHRTATAALEADLARAESQATAYRTYRNSGAYRLAEKLLRLRALVAPKGSWRAATARAVLNTARGAVRPVRWLANKLTARFAPAPRGFDTVRQRIEQSGRRPFVFLPSIPWNVVLFQRPQHLARELARLGHVVVYDATGTGDPPGGVLEVEPNVFVYHGPDRHLIRLPDPVVWAFSYNYHLADRFAAGATRVYDWIDDLAVFPHDQKMLQRNHDRAVREADVVASVARRLHEQLLAARPDAVYLPNAAEAERFAAPPARLPQDPALADLLARSTAVAGYYGALADWFDYPLLKAVAARLPDWGFVLIGPDYDGSIGAAGLDECRNVRWVGPRDYASLPGYLRLFDVATIPFAINDITLATSPLKLFEYFSAGVPVVTTPMPECVAFPEVRIATTADEFAAALVAARESGRSPAVRERLREVGRANTWAARARQILDVINKGGAVPLPPRAAAPVTGVYSA